MNLYQNKGGFSLVELMVAMAVIGILATLALGSYFTYRKSSLLNIVAEDFVSQVRLYRSEVNEKCMGLAFVPSDEGFVIEKFSREFRSKKTWNSIQEDWVFQGCEGEFASNGQMTIDRDINLQALIVDGEPFEDKFDCFHPF